MQQLNNADFAFLRHLKFENAVAGTLTMKQVCEGQWIDPIRCSENIRHFMNRLNSQVFGNAFSRKNKRIPVLPVQECSSDQRLHVHVIMSRPDFISYDDFVAKAEDCWKKTRYGYS